MKSSPIVLADNLESSSMTFALLPANPLKVVHFRRQDRRSDKLQTVQLRFIASALIVLDEQLNVQHVLELDEAQIHRRRSLQVLRFDTEREERSKSIHSLL